MTTEETFKRLFEKPYLIKNKKIVRDGKVYDIDVVYLPGATQQSNNIWLLIFYGKTILHREIFSSNHKEIALNRQNYIISNIENLLTNEFKGTKLDHYLNGEVFRTKEVLEYYMDFETDEKGFRKAVAKFRTVMVA